MNPGKQEGLYCKSCREFHSYSPRQLAFALEKYKDKWYVLWSCTKTGTQVGQIELGGERG